MLEWEAILNQAPTPEGALISPVVARNKDAILTIVRDVLPSTGTVLEVASGTGEHIVYFAANLHNIRWQPTDAEPRALASIKAHVRAAGLANVLEPLKLDVHDQRWPVEHSDVIIAINMLHIAPWSATEALIERAADILAEGGLLYMYGSFSVGGVHVSESNAAFDAKLRSHNTEWGVRDVDHISKLAQARGLHLKSEIPMPANNLSLVYEKRSAGR